MKPDETKKNIVEVRYTFWMISGTLVEILPKRNKLNIVFPDNMGKVSLVFKQKDFTLGDFLDNLLNVITGYKKREENVERGTEKSITP